MYTEEEKDKAFLQVRQRIADGESLRNILKGENAPFSSTIFFEMIKDKAKNEQYARACEIRAEAIFDEILEIADEANADVMMDEEGKMKVDGEVIQRSRLKVDARKWVLSKLNPKKYGEKIQQEIDHTTNGKDLPAVTVFQIPDNGRG